MGRWKTSLDHVLVSDYQGDKHDYKLRLSRIGRRTPWVAEIMGTRVMDDSPNSEQTFNMVNVELPLYNISED